MQISLSYRYLQTSNPVNAEKKKTVVKYNFFSLRRKQNENFKCEHMYLLYQGKGEITSKKDDLHVPSGLSLSVHRGDAWPETVNSDHDKMNYKMN